LRWNALLMSLIQYYHMVYSNPGRISPVSTVVARAQTSAKILDPK